MVAAEWLAPVSCTGRFDNIHAVPAALGLPCRPRFVTKDSVAACAINGPIEERADGERVENPSGRGRGRLTCPAPSSAIRPSPMAGTTPVGPSLSE
ncbi:hypothetical protein MKK88_29185 [Methylobacterium sp. E-005]|uniref:hypothetical protein n=1 Tax=Methylobacterium sp. E-005 TaxID=2836549 RepID=UPI001FB8FEDB|nr:hypothetical protein [Methylobacterium sp. E-005]MCJ2090033.1 hypothetical protein [Methylobacterium sp. E-005]